MNKDAVFVAGSHADEVDRFKKDDQVAGMAASCKRTTTTENSWPEK